MNAHLQQLLNYTRREFFQRAGMGVGGAALTTLLANDLQAALPTAANPMAARQSHFTPKAKT